MKIMYVCEVCAEACPEGCGHYDRSDLRVMPDGRWLCDECWDDARPRHSDPDDEARWSDLPVPPEYVPAVATP